MLLLTCLREMYRMQLLYTTSDFSQYYVLQVLFFLLISLYWLTLHSKYFCKSYNIFSLVINISEELKTYIGSQNILYSFMKIFIKFSKYLPLIHKYFEWDVNIYNLLKVFSTHSWKYSSSSQNISGSFINIFGWTENI